MSYVAGKLNERLGLQWNEVGDTLKQIAMHESLSKFKPTQALREALLQNEDTFVHATLDPFALPKEVFAMKNEFNEQEAFADVTHQGKAVANQYTGANVAAAGIGGGTVVLSAGRGLLGSYQPRFCCSILLLQSFSGFRVPAASPPWAGLGCDYDGTTYAITCSDNWTLSKTYSQKTSRHTLTPSTHTHSHNHADHLRNRSREGHGAHTRDTPAQP